MDSSKLTLCYWEIKGFTEPIRWLLHYVGQEYAETNPDKSLYTQWPKEKQELIDLGAPFINLPFLVDGDWRMTESAAIPVYIANRVNRGELLGRDWKETARFMELEGVLTDIRAELVLIMFMPDYLERHQKAVQNGSKALVKLGYLADYLGDREFLLGHVTYVDFLLAYLCIAAEESIGEAGLENPLTKFESLIRLKDRVLALDGVKEYIASEEYQQKPLVFESYKAWLKKSN